MRLFRRNVRYKILISGLLLALPVSLAAAPSGTAARAATPASAGSQPKVTSSSLGTFTPTFAGPAATGCKSANCDLLTGPTVTPSTASFALGAGKAAASAKAATAPSSVSAATLRQQAAANASLGSLRKVIPSPVKPRNGPDPAPATISCRPLGPGCDPVSLSSGGALGVKGLNAVDSGSLSTNVLVPPDIEPPDQGLCAGNGYVVEDNNIGEILIFDTRLHRVSSVISLDTLMGLTAKGWSSGGDISCVYDYSNGGHWFFTEFASASSEASGGPFSGCFIGVANTCYEAIAVTQGSSPFGPYNVYDLNANYNPKEPGAPYLLNDFTKIGVTRDAFLLFYDEFPQVTPGIGGGGFNGAQEFAFDKNALESGAPVTLHGNKPNPAFTVAIENMGLLPTPDGTCASDDTFQRPGITCWFSVIPALPPDPSQYDNSHGGTGFMLEALDFYGSGDTRIAVFDWTGLASLDSGGAAVRFGGQLFSGVDYYFDPNLNVPQKAGPIPLGAECGAAGWSVAFNGQPAPASCPEGPIATNGDNFTQVGQAQGQLWGVVSTQVAQSFAGEASSEDHVGALYFVLGTDRFDKTGMPSFTSQAYVSPPHEDLSMPVIAATGLPRQDGGDGGAIVAFTLTGNGGPTRADHGGFYPSTAFARVTATSGGATSPIYVPDIGQAPQDGLTEYAGYPDPSQLAPRWGDYSAALFVPGTGKIYFANEYIQYPSCTGSDFTLTVGTCGGTRDGNANWGTSVNSVTP